MNFPASKIMEHMQKGKNKGGDSSFKAKPFEIQIIICGERKKPIKITVCNCPEDVDMEKGREKGDLHCLS